MTRPLAIEVTDVAKSFRIPAEPAGVSRRWRPLLARRGRELPVLSDISFGVERGEFFGVVGRNGSGKSTLLKLLASIYRPTRGRIGIRGRLAPFLELGVGFHPDLTAYDNVVVNGVMMGLRPGEAKARFEEIVEFAGLAEHADLKLRNYSSGMKVRLGFSVMTHVDADVLLIDEVLAVGDAEFQEKCGEVFRQMHDEGRTVVLVTHSMSAVLTYCERAMLLDAGRIASIGDPEEVTNRYLELNTRALASRTGGLSGFHAQVSSALAHPAVRVVEAWFANARGERTVELEVGEPIELHAVFEVDRDIAGPRLYLKIDNARGQTVFVTGGNDPGMPLKLHPRAGDRVHLRAVLANRLVGGRYLVSCAMLKRGDDGPSEPAGPVRTLRFDLPGRGGGGVLDLEPDVAVEVERTQELAKP
jgi:ABC-type polysaccharide/polyol phosphate transport system ATPase subunit